jgi:hypothetical protein
MINFVILCSSRNRPVVGIEAKVGRICKVLRGTEKKMEENVKTDPGMGDSALLY